MLLPIAKSVLWSATFVEVSEFGHRRDMPELDASKTLWSKPTSLGKELERRLAPGNGVGGSGPAWMKVFWTMPESVFGVRAKGFHSLSPVDEVLGDADGVGVDTTAHDSAAESPASSLRSGSSGQNSKRDICDSPATAL